MTTTVSFAALVCLALAYAGWQRWKRRRHPAVLKREALRSNGLMFGLEWAPGESEAEFRARLVKRLKGPLP